MYRKLLMYRGLIVHWILVMHKRLLGVHGTMLVMYWNLLVLQLALRVLMIIVTLGLYLWCSLHCWLMDTGWLRVWCNRARRCDNILRSYFPFPRLSYTDFFSSTLRVLCCLGLAFDCMLPSWRDFTCIMYGEGMLSEIIKPREVTITETLVRLFPSVFSVLQIS